MPTANVNLANNLVSGTIGIVSGIRPCDAGGMPTVVMVKFLVLVSWADGSVCRCRLWKLQEVEVETCVHRFFKSQGR